MARAGGIIIELKVERGDLVTAGETIATISDEGRQSAVEQAQALLDQRIAEYDANKPLIDRARRRSNQLPALEAAVAAARAALAAAQAEADRSLIRSPIDGIVDTVPVQIGQAVQIGTEIADDRRSRSDARGRRGQRARRGNVRVGQAATMRFIDGATQDRHQ